MINLRHKLISFLSIVYTILIRKKFKHFGKSKIYTNTLITNPNQISIGDGTIVREGSWLLAIEDEEKQSAKIKLGNNVYLGRYLHLTSKVSVEIEDDVIIADRVFISDNNHGYADISVPIKDQKITFKSRVIVKKGAWIGENACILSCSVGKNSIIGANAVVINTVPDYSIAVGNPAIIIKRYNEKSKTWEKTDPNGEFING